MKTLAFVFGLGIFAFSAIGILTPSAWVGMAQGFATPVAWYAIGAVRLALGVLLLSVAKTSRAPRTLRVVAFIPLCAGLAAIAIGFVGVERARAMIESWSRLGSGYQRLSYIPTLVLGGFIAYACAPARRAA